MKHGVTRKRRRKRLKANNNSCSEKTLKKSRLKAIYIIGQRKVFCKKGIP